MKTSVKNSLRILLIFSRLSQFALLLEIMEFWLELKRGAVARVPTEMLEIIALPFRFSSKLNMWSFHVVVVKEQQRNVQKRVMHVQSCRFAHQTYCFFWRSCCRRRRSFVRSLLGNNDGDGNEKDTSIESEVALLQTLSRLFHLVQFIKC